MLRRAPALALALLALPAASASAGTVSFDRSCYVSGQPDGVVSMSGFAPDALLNVTSKYLGDATTVRTDATGNAALGFAAAPPESLFPVPGSKAITVTATEVLNAGSTASGTSRVAPLAFQTSNVTQSADAQRRWWFSGWTRGKPIYAHFRLQGRTRSNFRMGVATGVCGEYKRMAEGIAVPGSASTGTWTIAVDQRRTYSPKSRPQLVDQVPVFPVTRRRGSAASFTAAALLGRARFY